MAKLNLKKFRYMTNEERVLAYLQNRKGGLDSITAFDKTGVHRLSAAVNNLRKQGHNIVTESVTYDDGFGRDIEVANYRLA